MEELMIKIDGVSKEYKLGQIGGTTLREEFQRFGARLRKQDDPTRRIGGNAEIKSGTPFLALDNVSFEVKKGERIGIIGHNGAGKSTLLKLLSRVTAPSSGYIGLNGRIASMLEVGTGFHGELTGRENIYMNGAILGMSKKEIDAKIDDIIEFSECSRFIDTPVKRYSSGMYVKLAFSVAAHLDSEIMIMDEVLAVGDMAFQKKCLDKMNDVSRKDGRTILYVSHNMHTIRQLCDRCIVLEHGHLVFDGDVEEAISLYLMDKQSENAVDYDLSHKRMPHLRKDPLAKIMRVTLKGKEMPFFEYNEPIKFKMIVQSNKVIENTGLRFELRTASGIPVGIALKNNIGRMKSGETCAFDVSILPEGLVNGRYYVCLVLHESNDVGNYIDLDAIYPAFVFEIRDTKNAIGLQWNQSNWGSIKFEQFSVQ